MHFVVAVRDRLYLSLFMSGEAVTVACLQNLSSVKRTLFSIILLFLVTVRSTQVFRVPPKNSYAFSFNRFLKIVLELTSHITENMLAEWWWSEITGSWRDCQHDTLSRSAWVLCVFGLSNFWGLAKRKYLVMILRKQKKYLQCLTKKNSFPWVCKPVISGISFWQFTAYY